MRGLNIAMQIECDCGYIVEFEQSSTQGLPMLKQFEFGCVQCGRKFFTHTQETKPSEVVHPKSGTENNNTTEDVRGNSPAAE